MKCFSPFFPFQDMTDNSNSQLVVRAKFNFQQTNEDELSFAKGDVIHVTRVEEGGWWEGTHSGRTGWFPSNYVREVKPSGECGAGGGLSSGPEAGRGAGAARGALLPGGTWGDGPGQRSPALAHRFFQPPWGAGEKGPSLKVAFHSVIIIRLK